VFDSEIDSTGFSPGLFVVQLFGVPIASLVLGGFTSSLLLGALSDGFSNFVDYFCFGLAGFLLGFKAEQSTPDLRKSGGLWVWILPVCLFTWGFVEEVRLFPATAFHMLVPRPHGDPGGSIALLFLTLPTFASCLYSVGIFVASRKVLFTKVPFHPDKNG